MVSTSLRRHYPDQVLGVKASSLLSADRIRLPQQLSVIPITILRYCQL